MKKNRGVVVRCCCFLSAGLRNIISVLSSVFALLLIARQQCTLKKFLEIAASTSLLILGLAGSSYAADLASCVGVTQIGDRELNVYRNAQKPVALWKYSVSAAAVESVAVSADGTRLAYASSTRNGLFVNLVDHKGGQLTRPVTDPTETNSPFDIEWVGADRLLTSVHGHAASDFQLWKVSLVGAKELSLVGTSVLSNQCQRIDAADQLLCASMRTLELNDDSVGHLDLSNPDIQPRVATKKLRLTLGQDALVPGTAGSQVGLSEVVDGAATLRLKGGQIGSESTLSAGEWTAIEFSEPPHLVRVATVEPTAVQLELIELPAEPFDFGPIAVLQPGSALVGLRAGDNDSTFVELWQQRGSSFQRTQRVALPRNAELRQLRMDAPGVLVVHDELGQYALSYSLTFDTAGLPSGIHFATMQGLPERIAGQEVVQWRCSR